jgi:hypothetical protein
MSDDRQAYYDLLAALGALAAGLCAGWVDFRIAEPQPAVILLLSVGAILGFTRPERAWRWAIVLGFGIPVAFLSARGFGYEPEGLSSVGLYATLLALAPTFIGVYGGVLMRRVAFSHSR